MSKDDVPGEKRTTSPGPATAWARSTASARELAMSELATPLQDRLMLSASSPIRIVDLTFSSIRDRSGSNVKPLSLPPTMRMTGLVCARSAFSTASRFVAFESFTYVRSEEHTSELQSRFDLV